MCGLAVLGLQFYRFGVTLHYSHLAYSQSDIHCILTHTTQVVGATVVAVERVIVTVSVVGAAVVRDVVVVPAVVGVHFW